MAHPRCLADALLRHQSRETRPDGRPALSDLDVHLIVTDAVEAGTAGPTALDEGGFWQTRPLLFPRALNTCPHSAQVITW